MPIDWETIEMVIRLKDLFIQDTISHHCLMMYSLFIVFNFLSGQFCVVSHLAIVIVGSVK